MGAILRGIDLDKRKRIVANVKANEKRFAWSQWERNRIGTRTLKACTETYGYLFKLSLFPRAN